MKGDGNAQRVTWGMAHAQNQSVQIAGLLMIIIIWLTDFIDFDYVFAYKNNFYCNDSNDMKLGIINLQCLQTSTVYLEP